MEGRVGPGSWVMFVDGDGIVVEGRAISDPEGRFRGPQVIWVDVAQDDGGMLTTPVPVNEVRLVERQ